MIKYYACKCGHRNDMSKVENNFDYYCEHCGLSYKKPKGNLLKYYSKEFMLVLFSILLGFGIGYVAVMILKIITFNA